jgi:hypothetical protein
LIENVEIAAGIHLRGHRVVKQRLGGRSAIAQRKRSGELLEYVWIVRRLPKTRNRGCQYQRDQ